MDMLAPVMFMEKYKLSPIRMGSYLAMGNAAVSALLCAIPGLIVVVTKLVFYLIFMMTFMMIFMMIFMIARVYLRTSQPGSSGLLWCVFTFKLKFFNRK